MFMTIQSNVKDKILATPSETSKVENAPAEMLRDLDQQMEKRADDEPGYNNSYFLLILVIVDDYSRYTWTHFLRSKDETPGVKDITTYASKCRICLRGEGCNVKDFWLATTA
ncbi:hypothetical protein Tco_0267505 [Tanacetum coccineum]